MRGWGNGDPLDPLLLGGVGWGSPLAAWGLLALLVPLLLHLLVRQRAPEVRLPSLRFLLPRAPTRSRISPPSDRVLLALRLALVALAVAALADPRWSGGEASSAPGAVEGAGARVPEPAPGGPEGPPGGDPEAQGADAAPGRSRDAGTLRAPGSPEPPRLSFDSACDDLGTTHPRVSALLEREGSPPADLSLALPLKPEGVARMARLGRTEEGASTLGPSGSPWVDEGGGWFRWPAALGEAPAVARPPGAPGRPVLDAREPGGDPWPGDPNRAARENASWENEAQLCLDPARWPDTPATAALLLRLEAEARRDRSREETVGAPGPPPTGEGASPGEEEGEEEGRPLRSAAWALVLLLLLAEGWVRARRDGGEG